jgi:dTDP-4-dehydrorhamnose reductase
MAGTNEKLQLWGGIECTVNRVGESFFDQVAYSGHDRRLSDLDLIAELDIKVLRYPAIWERSEANGLLDFQWLDERLLRLYQLRVDPVLGLVHHGSGPAHTSLVSECFPEKLAEYAGQVARRYPWVDRFTPVNEPLTTARFSGLYGHWHPHGRDDRTFVRALLTQCKGVALSMGAIRRVNSRALLVQTEDMGFTRSTDSLRDQADFENQRRWLSFDLLAGRVTRRHPLYGYLSRAGATERELGYFEEQPCPADVIGINYYVTSERFLDGRVGLYAPDMIGGNGRQHYVDVEAVRVCADGLVGLTPILTEAHERYRKPVCVTEAHIGCNASQQASWLSHIWRSALQARADGAQVEAITAWALFGAFGWDRLVTQGAVSYEPGAFELIDGLPQQTAVTDLLRRLSRGEAGACEQGWWTRADRLLYEPHVPRSRAA